VNEGHIFGVGLINFFVPHRTSGTIFRRRSSHRQRTGAPQTPLAHLPPQPAGWRDYGSLFLHEARWIDRPQAVFLVMDREETHGFSHLSPRKRAHSTIVPPTGWGCNARQSGNRTLASTLGEGELAPGCPATVPPGAMVHRDNARGENNMIRNLLATTAIVSLMAGTAYAQEATTPTPADPAPMTDKAAPVHAADGFLATKLIGENVYNGTNDDAEKIGDVNDLVIGPTGTVDQIVVGVGGFLGIGEKNVSLAYDEIKWAERDGDRWIVVNATKDQLKAQPEFDRSAYEAMPATAAAPAATTAPADNMAAAPAPADNMAATADTAKGDKPVATGTDTMAQAPATETPDQTRTGAIDKSTLSEMSTDQIRAEDLVGTTVYGANDANVGEIGDVILTQDGKVDAVIIDVGGFLGMGEKEVAVGMDKLSFMTDTDGHKYLYTSFTEEQLKAAPAYDKSTWADHRDEQRILVQ
jgi:sporulation protein YlmC with PRC-barrel domain